MLALAIDLGGTHATCALVRDGQILSKQTVSSSGSDELGPMLPRFTSVFRDIVARSGLRVEDCAGVALGFCGLADFDAGRVLSTDEKYADAPGLDLTAWAREDLGLPFRIENDARLALLGERTAGAARGSDDVVMMTLGTGIGGAAMIGGKLLRGKHYQAGCLVVLASQQLSTDHGRPADAGSQGHHDDIVAASRRSRGPLSKQGQACVVLNAERQSEVLAGPCRQIETRCVCILLVGGEHAPGIEIGQPAEAQRYSRTVFHAEAAARDDVAKNAGKAGQHRPEFVRPGR